VNILVVIVCLISITLAVVGGVRIFKKPEDFMPSLMLIMAGNALTMLALLSDNIFGS
jgi:hypothetical protein